MVCCTQKGFYEASHLHLFNFASIKLAEATAVDTKNTNDHRMAMLEMHFNQIHDALNMSDGRKTNAKNQLENKKSGKKTCYAGRHALT